MQWKLSLALGLCLVFMVVEVVGGIMAHRSVRSTTPIPTADGDAGAFSATCRSGGAVSCASDLRGVRAQRCTMLAKRGYRSIDAPWVTVTLRSGSRSLAVLTDAAHLLSDVSGFGVSLWAAWYATRRSQSTHTFGCALGPSPDLLMPTGLWDMPRATGRREAMLVLQGCNAVMQKDRNRQMFLYASKRSPVTVQAWLDCSLAPARTQAAGLWVSRGC